jgi:hypothetical protein
VTPDVPPSLKATQQWQYDAAAGSLELASIGGGCIDVSACDDAPGAAVRLYESSDAAYACGAPGQPGACDAKNEVWRAVALSAPKGAVRFASGLDAKLCLAVDATHGASLAACSDTDAAQQFTIAPVSAAEGSAARTVTLAAVAGANMCLTGSVAAARGDGFDGHRFTSRAALARAAEALFPTATAGLSRAYANAYTVSDAWMKRKEARECPAETCPKGYGAPQGALGEVYATHTTLAATSAGGLYDAYTWRFVVGVQVSVALNITAADVGLDDVMASASRTFKTYSWDDATTFRPTAPLAAFSAGSPLLVARQAASECTTGVGRISATTACFPFQWHVIAPTFPSGWTLTGEVGKMMPISKQRVAKIDDDAALLAVHVVGAPGEVVTFGAAMGAQSPQYASATVGSDGTATLSFRAAARSIVRSGTGVALRH